jgi:hypothetical protein
VTDEGRERRVSDVAVVDGSDVLVVNGPDGPRLPQLDEGFPSPAQVFAAAGIGPGAAVAAPTRRVDGSPVRAVHLVTVERRPDGTEWLPLGRLVAPAGVVDAITRGLDEWTGRTPRPANRPAWYASGWSADADRWIDAQLAGLGRRRAGPSEPVKIWSLSAVLRVPTRTATDDAAADPVFFKAACDWFGAEPAITQTLAAIAPLTMPTVLAADSSRAWMLMSPLPGGGSEPSVGTAVAAATALARLQVTVVDHVPGLRAAGLPDRTLRPTCTGLAAVVEDSIELSQLTADERAAATAMLPWLLGRVEAFAQLGLPYSVAHGDLHLGNVAADDDTLTIFDWTDAAVSFPFLDATHLAASTRSDAEVGPRVLAAYADVWGEGYDRAVVDRMIDEAPLVNRVYQMVSYEGIYRSREPDSLWEMRGIVAQSLRQLIGQWRSATA